MSVLYRSTLCNPPGASIHPCIQNTLLYCMFNPNGLPSSWQLSHPEPSFILKSLLLLFFTKWQSIILWLCVVAIKHACHYTCIKNVKELWKGITYFYMEDSSCLCSIALMALSFLIRFFCIYWTKGFRIYVNVECRFGPIWYFWKNTVWFGILKSFGSQFRVVKCGIELNWK